MLILTKKYKFHKIFLIFIFLFFNNNLKANIIRDAEIENFLTEMANPIFEAANLNLNSVDIYIFNDTAQKLPVNDRLLSLDLPIKIYFHNTILKDLERGHLMLGGFTLVVFVHAIDVGMRDEGHRDVSSAAGELKEVLLGGLGGSGGHAAAV